jgi:hypothetical protein
MRPAKKRIVADGDHVVHQRLYHWERVATGTLSLCTVGNRVRHVDRHDLAPTQ